MKNNDLEILNKLEFENEEILKGLIELKTREEAILKKREELIDRQKALSEKLKRFLYRDREEIIYKEIDDLYLDVAEIEDKNNGSRVEYNVNRYME